MLTKKSRSRQATAQMSVILFGFGLMIFMFNGCTGSRPPVSASSYQFSFKNQDYQIRSIASVDVRESCNELKANNLLAIDFDQDGIIDRVVLGNLTLSEAQQIYDYGLDKVAKENKIQERVPVLNYYVHENADYDYEIRSFQPINSQPFNQFKVIDKRPMIPSQLVIIVDQNADGNLDEVLVGITTPEQYQAKYAEILKEGIQKNKLVKTDNMILVKEK